MNTYVVGRSLNITKRYHYLEVDPSTGRYKFEDMNGDGAINSSDKLFVSEIAPKFYGGITNSISFAGFQLDILFQFVSKNGYSYLGAFAGAPGTAFNQNANVLNNDWEREGDAAIIQRYTSDPGAVQTAYNRFIGSNANIVDASFIRLKNVSLSYSLSINKSNRVSSKFYIQGQNLFTITNYEGLDPETASSSSLPTLKTIILGIQISL
jgi:hypothetical protein